MKDNFLIRMATAISLLCPLGAYSQNNSHSIEVGLGGAAVNHTRAMVSDFHQSQGGDYVFTLKEKLLYGGANIYGAYEIRPWLYADLQATFGQASYYEAAVKKRGWSVMAGPGLQLRPLTRSQWVQPFARVGVGYYRKNFPAAYFGRFDGDITKEAIWKAEDSWNRGFTFDANSFCPVSVGVGLIGWLGDRVGVRIEGDYLRSIGAKGGNYAQGTLGMLFRFGGRSLVRGGEPVERVLERIVEKEVIKEVPVETVREVVREVPVGNELALLMDNVTFDFDKAELTPQSERVLDEVAKVILMYPDERFLICGYTDAKGSDSYNERLSAARAKAVHDALIGRGVPSEMLCYRGLGKRDALVPQSAEDDLRRGDRKVVVERVSWEPLWRHLKEQQSKNFSE